MIGGRSALLSAAGGGNPYGNWTGNYSDVSLLLRNGVPNGAPVLLPVDESPTPKAITTFGNAGMSTTTFKYGDSSLVFDGDGDYLSMPVDAGFEFGTGDFTVEFWLRFVSISSGINPIINLGIGAVGGSLVLNSGWGVHFRPGVFWLFRFDGAEKGYAFNANLSTSVWYHVAFTRSGNSLRCFVNGTQVGTTQSTSLSYDRLSNDPLQIGFFRTGDGGSTYNYLHGLIDDLRITKGVARYTSNFTPPAAELPANATDDPSYNSVSLLLRNGAPVLLPVDESPTPKAITTFGNAGMSTTTFKYGGSSLVLDGGGDHATIPFDAGFEFGTGDFTVEGWFYFVDINTTLRGIVALGDGDNVSGPVTNSWSLRYLGSEGSNQIQFSRYDGATVISYTTTGVSVTPNSWHHIAVCRGSGILRIFFNGVSYYSASNAVNYSVINASHPLRVGLQYYGTQLTYGGPRYWNGFIDDLRITKGVARYTKNFLPPPAELPAI